MNSLVRDGDEDIRSFTSCKQQTVQPTIIDNKPTTLNNDQIDTKLHQIFTHLKQGGIVITPTATIDLPKQTNSFLNIDNYPTNIFGKHLYIHLANDKDLRPWLRLNQIDTGTTLEEIPQTLDVHNIIHEGLHRKINGKLTTTLILFKTNDQQQHNLLINK